MKIRMKTLASGVNFSAIPGQEIDVDPQRGKELIAGGYAESIEVVTVAKPKGGNGPEGKDKAGGSGA